VSRRPVDSFLSPKAQRSLELSLLSRLSLTGKQAANWVFTILLNTPGLVDVNIQKNIAHVFERVVFANGLEAFTMRLLQSFPALARLWNAQGNDWLQHAGTFIRDARRFCRAQLSSDTKIAELGMDVSDLHDHNRAVIRVRFDDRRIWFYKPRNGSKEKWWFALLQEINSQGFPTQFAILKTIHAKRHFWMAAACRRSCRNNAGAVKYYYRTGALLYLLRWLRGVDFHAGNLIAFGSQPVIVDCETLLHPEIPLPAKFYGERSLTRTGMLPNLSPSNSFSPDSVSALGRKSFGHHTVRVGKEPVMAETFVDSIIRGYTAMHRFLGDANVIAQLRPICRKLQSCPTRYVYRPTIVYYSLLESSLSVDALRSQSRRGAMLQSECRASASVRAQSNFEVRALLRGDIPALYGPSAKPYRPSAKNIAEDVQILRRALAKTLRN
jgi:lantibiotic modifying enzyme